jgi:adenosine deaminase
VARSASLPYDAAGNDVTMAITLELLKALPKTDLHVHLDGSLRLPTLIELAQERGVSLPSSTTEGMQELVFKDRYDSLVDYLKGFNYTTAVLRDSEALERAAYELMADNIEEGVRYVEVRFAPQLHIGDSLDMLDVYLAVNRGLKRATDEHNRAEPIRSGQEPPFRYGMIVCAMRMFTDEFSPYFGNLLRVHRESPSKQVFGMASLELARAAVRIRDDYGLPIVGFDLAGQENGYPAIDHVEAYQFAHEHFLKKTVHAGEAYGPESIFQAITALHADRIGHGYHLFSPWLIEAKNVADRGTYVRELSEYIADRRITIEVCITSNLQTNPHIRVAGNHAMQEMLNRRLSITLCTDNRLVSNTSVTRELMLAAETFGLDRKVLKNIIIYGFKRSFFPGTYIEKRDYVRRVINYYESVEERLLGDVVRDE